jgi:hypothetical protein
MVKRLYKRSGVIKLLSGNPLSGPIVLKEGQERVIFGVVTYIINEAKLICLCPGCCQFLLCVLQKGTTAGSEAFTGNRSLR